MGVGVRLPELQQVIGRDVGLVAHRDKCADSQAELGPMGEDGHPERAALAQESEVAVGRDHGREGGVESNVRVGVDDTEAVGPAQAHAGGARNLDHTVLPRPALRARLGEPGAHDDRGTRPGPPGGLDDRLHVLGRDRDDHQVDGLREALDAGPRPDALHGAGAGIDGVDRAGKAGPQQIAKDLGADCAAAAAGANHGDHSGPQHRIQGLQENHSR